MKYCERKVFISGTFYVSIRLNITGGDARYGENGGNWLSELSGVD